MKAFLCTLLLLSATHNSGAVEREKLTLAVSRVPDGFKLSVTNTSTKQIDLGVWEGLPKPMVVEVWSAGVGARFQHKSMAALGDVFLFFPTVSCAPGKAVEFTVKIADLVPLAVTEPEWKRAMALIKESIDGLRVRVVFQMPGYDICSDMTSLTSR